jgi:16S rRNA (cytosine1402-N4)-methyltransferase
LLDEVVDLLAPRPGGVYVDGTAGSGGHALAIAGRIGPTGRLLLIDRDREAVLRVRAALADSPVRVSVVEANFADMKTVARANGIERADGILLDLGVSSNQLDEAERGFSFMRDGPLDMRMDRTQPLTAETLLNEASEERLEKILRDYGEEPRARAIVRRVAAARSSARLTRTAELARLVEAVYGGRRGRIHPATRTFQALRIAVNNELEVLALGLNGALELLAPAGRLAVISFHSLEDRTVKHFFADHTVRWESRPEGGRTRICSEPEVTTLTRKPVVASERECEANPRARSAKLRVAERKD